MTQTIEVPKTLRLTASGTPIDNAMTVIGLQFRDRVVMTTAGLNPMAAQTIATAAARLPGLPS
jgi:hypothetical protein